ncbi:hypothetical protein BGY98DRAFT_1007719 [Russula aff. rugulosa BPL654]|nr:hypothetical protein BGY98DRAFT_1007719 [Russula aff. rugulosa BPL654]
MRVQSWMCLQGTLVLNTASLLWVLAEDRERACSRTQGHTGGAWSTGLQLGGRSRSQQRLRRSSGQGHTGRLRGAGCGAGRVTWHRKHGHTCDGS